MDSILLQAILNENQKANEDPISTITIGSVTYIVYGAINAGGETGYKVKKITSNADSTIIEQGFLFESLRVSGANGSGSNVDLKDSGTAGLLLQDSSIIYG